MRRASDIDPGQRNGRGRRARDRLLSGEPPASPPASSSDLEHLLYFMGDDLRAAALAMGGIERFLLAAEHVLAAGPNAENLTDLVQETDVDDRLGDLECALGSLLQALGRLREGLAAGEDGYSDIPTLKSA